MRNYGELFDEHLEQLIQLVSYQKDENGLWIFENLEEFIDSLIDRRTEE